MDAILKHLLEQNIVQEIEYSDRLLIPKGGLQKMLDNFNGYRLNKVEVTKDELAEPNNKWEKSPLEESTIEELYDLIG